MPYTWSLFPSIVALLTHGAHVAARSPGDQKVRVEIFEWQGCPDCVVFGERLSTFGLQRGLGKIMNLTVSFREGTHPGIDYDSKLHAWAACASKIDIDQKDVDGYWYQTIACAHSRSESIEKCLHHVNMPSNLSAPMLSCVKGASADKLVEAMHAYSATIDDFPWVLVNSKAMPPPDEHEDRVEPVIREICRAAGKTRTALVPACQEDSFIELHKARMLKGPREQGLRKFLKHGIFLKASEHIIF